MTHALVARRRSALRANERRYTDDPDKDERYTPATILEWALRVVGETSFDLDVAACAQSHMADRYFTKKDNALVQPWECHCWWGNVPFSKCGEFVAHAWRCAEFGQFNIGAMLLPASRSEQDWWQEHVEPVRDGRARRHGYELSTHFMPTRPRFISKERNLTSAPFPVVLLVWRRTSAARYTTRSTQGEAA